MFCFCLFVCLFVYFTVKCPRGYFYDVASKTCKKCAVGSISKQEGSLQCESCPAKSSTLVEGSKVCTGNLNFICFSLFVSSLFLQNQGRITIDFTVTRPSPLSGLQKIPANHTCHTLYGSARFLSRVNIFYIRYDTYDRRKSFSNRSQEFWFKWSPNSKIDGHHKCHQKDIEIIYHRTHWGTDG